MPRSKLYEIRVFREMWGGHEGFWRWELRVSNEIVRPAAGDIVGWTEKKKDAAALARSVAKHLRLKLAPTLGDQAWRKTCTWCVKAITPTEEIVNNRDAGNNKHSFHVKCWKLHVKWMNAK